MNGNVQDISPPGTPTNDDTLNISGISLAPLYTPCSGSPLLNTSLTNVGIHLPLHTPTLSPGIMNSSVQVPAPFLHPLQQALLLQQQQISTVSSLNPCIEITYK